MYPNLLYRLLRSAPRLQHLRLDRIFYPLQSEFFPPQTVLTCLLFEDASFQCMEPVLQLCHNTIEDIGILEGMCGDPLPQLKELPVMQELMYAFGGFPEASYQLSLANIIRSCKSLHTLILESLFDFQQLIRANPVLFSNLPNFHLYYSTDDPPPMAPIAAALRQMPSLQRFALTGFDQTQDVVELLNSISTTVQQLDLTSVWDMENFIDVLEAITEETGTLGRLTRLGNVTIHAETLLTHDLDPQFILTNRREKTDLIMGKINALRFPPWICVTLHAEYKLIWSQKALRL